MTIADSPWVPTKSGRRFRPLDPRPADIRIEDIARGLASKYRFGGMCRRYTVAQHSVHVAERLFSSHGVRIALWGLLHDAAEAWLWDVQAPIKPLVFFALEDEGQRHYCSFDAVEEGILRAVAIRFGLVWPLPAEIEEVDLRLRATERRDLFEEPIDFWESPAREPYPERIVPWGASVAEEIFEKRFREYGGFSRG